MAALLVGLHHCYCKKHEGQNVQIRSYSYNTSVDREGVVPESGRGHLAATNVASAPIISDIVLDSRFTDGAASSP